MKITVNTLRGRWQGRERWLSDGGSRGAGRLVVRMMRDGAALYFQHYHDGQKRLLPLGEYDETGKRGLNLVKARDKAAELSALCRSGTTDLHGHFERQRAAEERAQRAEEEAARREAEAAQRSTLRQLLDAYTGHLERLGKQSAPAVKAAFKRHVIDGAPDLADRKAAEISADDFLSVIGRLVEKGNGREAAKLRSYLRAAYSLALKSRTSPLVPVVLKSFGITVNPVAAIEALPEYNNARNRTLNAEELVAFMKRLDAMADSIQKDAVRLCILLGGQRPAQLVRVKPVDIDLPAGTVTLYDSKGARRQARQHVVPLVKPAREIFSRLLDALEEDAPLFSTDGETLMRAETLSAYVTRIVRDMVKAKEARDPFQLRDVRRTVETMLAGIGVSSDVRAQLQSHGLGGVQLRHYNHHDYMPEKRRALELWTRHIERLKSGKAAKVVPLRRKSRV